LPTGYNEVRIYEQGKAIIDTGISITSPAPLEVAFSLSQYNNGYNVSSSGYGYGGFVNPYRSVAPVSYNFFGYFNWDAASRSIIHIFRTSSNIYLNNKKKCEEDCKGVENEIVKVIISYQTSGSTPGEEILIPEYAVMAMDAGILWQQSLFNAMDRDRGRKNEYYFNSQKTELNKYLNPIRIDDVKKVQTNLRPW
jgi:hypothetical protein